MSLETAPTIATINVVERENAFIEGDIQGIFNGVLAPVPLASVATFTRTIYDLATGQVVNSVENQNILNANGGTYHTTSGHFTLTFASLDNQLIGTPAVGERETHICLLVLTWGSSGRWNRQIKLRVKAMERVP